MFSKGLVDGFGPKLAIFSSSFFLGNLGQENVFDGNLARKNAFLCYKSKEFEKLKNWDFFQNKELKKTKNWYVQSKGLAHGFGPKLAIFPFFFLFKQSRQGECVLWYCRAKKRFSSDKKPGAKKDE